MREAALIFRAEALRGRETQRSTHRAARASPWWIAGAYWALLALVAAGLTAGALIRVGEVAQGPAVVREGAVETVVPAVYASDLHPGMPLKLTLRGHRPMTVAVTGAGPEVANAAAAGRLLRTAVSGAGSAPGALLVVRATVPQRVAEGAAGTASVQVSSQRLIVALFAGLVSSAADG
jgi:hypothetical protein